MLQHAVRGVVLFKVGRALGVFFLLCPLLYPSSSSPFRTSSLCGTYWIWVDFWSYAECTWRNGWKEAWCNKAHVTECNCSNFYLLEQIEKASVFNGRHCISFWAEKRWSIKFQSELLWIQKLFWLVCTVLNSGYIFGNPMMKAVHKVKYHTFWFCSPNQLAYFWLWSQSPA